ncbi:MAG: hypothetical protein Q4G30_08815 [Actinomycetaceae bacterium]|nr:hypothetical protein [Actinomycetaceae bacterium]
MLKDEEASHSPFGDDELGALMRASIAGKAASRRLLALRRGATQLSDMDWKALEDYANSGSAQ